MFTNIGSKIKTLAVILCALGIVASFVAFIAMCTIDEDMVGMGFLTLIGGSLFSWIGSFFTYGFGELIEKTSNIELILRGENAPAATYAPTVSTAPTTPSADATHRQNLDKWKEQGLITEEEYQAEITRLEQK